jgi:ABC-type multidrug transport system fused ATPase/permease subunit
VARAAYSNDTELAILDDPFAAVDGPTGQHILEKLVCGPIMKGKTRVIVCQPDLNRIKNFDKVIVMKYGRIVAQGTPAEIVKLREYRELLNKHQEIEVEDSQAQATGSARADGEGNHSRKSEVISLRDEEEEGRAEWEQINYFFELGRWKYVYGLSFFMMLMVFTGLASDITLARWVNNITYGGDNPASLYLWGFAFWGLISMFMFAAFYLYGMTFTLRVSSTLFKTLLDSLMNAPIDRFYDKTPVGRIMNRLSTELGAMDYGFFGCIGGILGTTFAFIVPLGYVHYVMPLYFSICCIPFYFLLLQVVKRY